MSSSRSHFPVLTANRIVPASGTSVAIPALAVNTIAMTGNLNMATHNITNVGTVTSTNVAVGTLAVNGAGSITTPALSMTGNIDMNTRDVSDATNVIAEHLVGSTDVTTPTLTSAAATIAIGKPLDMGANLISNLAAPVAGTDAATRTYVLTQVAGVVTTVPNFDILFTGPWAADQTVACHAQRVGNVVTVQFGPVIGVAGTVAAAATCAVDSLPATCRPATRVDASVPTIDGVVGDATGSVAVLNNGTVTIAGVRTTGVFAIGAQSGWYAFAITYIV